MIDIIRKLGITHGSIYLPLTRSMIKFMSEREERISRLVSIFPEYKDDVLANIRNMEIKTIGLQWCIDYALSGESWNDIKKLINE